LPQKGRILVRPGIGRQADLVGNAVGRWSAAEARVFGMPSGLTISMMSAAQVTHVPLHSLMIR
jgi:hypothetical protein